MMKAFTTPIFLLSAPVWLQGQESVRIDPLQANEGRDGCGTGFQLLKPKNPTSQDVIALDNRTDEYLIRVNGRLHRLKFVSEKVSPKGKGKDSLGASIEEIYKDDQVTLTLKYKVISIGPENYDFIGSAKISLGSVSITHSIKGDRGC